MQEALLGFIRALGAFRGDCTVLHFARRIAARWAIAARRRRHHVDTGGITGLARQRRPLRAGLAHQRNDGLQRRVVADPLDAHLHRRRHVQAAGNH